MSVLPVGIAASGDVGYTLDNSLRFRSSAGAYLSRTTGTSNRRTWTWSGWIKLTKENTTQIFSAGSSSSYVLQARVVTGNGIQIYQDWAGSTVMNIWTGTNTQLRDFSNWYHIVYAVDTTQATSTDRVKIYLNGVQLTAFTNNTYPPQNYELSVNYNPFYIASYLAGVATSSDAYQTEINFIDGQALTADDFGEFDEDTGVWKPKAYSGTYGTNGFYLDASTSGSTVLDQSGNSNNWTANNMNLTTSSATTYDLMNDVPTLTDEDTANFATWNPLLQSANTFSEGNLKVAFSASTPAKVISTIKMPSGKWYAEFTMPGANNNPIGLSATDSTDNYLWLNSIGYWTGTSSSSLYVNGSVISGLGALNVGWASGDILGFAVDKDNDILSIIKNGTILGSYDFSSYNFGPMFYACGNYISGLTNTVNFGQRPFKYTPPTGYKKLNTYNLPDSTIEDGSEHFNTVLYTGTGVSRSITVGFQPDFIWWKGRNQSSSHLLMNAVVGNTRYLYSNSTSAEQTDGTNVLTSFDSDGYTLPNDTGGYANYSGRTYANWNWKANGSGVSNSEGDITVTVSADTTSGFSIVKGTYTGVASSQTFGHGLGATPAMIITKDISGAANFGIWHETYGATSGNTQIMIFTTNATLSAGNYMGTVSSTLSSVSSGLIVNGNDFVQWIWTEIEGFSAFGSYTGNGSADGPFIYTGFRPAWVMVKRADAVEQWSIYDSVRNPENIVDLYLRPELSNTEASLSPAIDFTSNGLKIRTANGSLNTSGGTYIYAAFAENPFKNSLAR